MFKDYVWCLVAVLFLSVSSVAMAQDDIDLDAADDALDAAVKVDDNAAGGEAAEVKEAPPAEVKEVTDENAAPDKGKVVIVEDISEPQVVENSPKTKKRGGNENSKHKALMYFPNLFLDFGDIFSLTLGAGAKSGVEIRLTRWCQIGGTYGANYFVEKGFERRYGGGYDDGYEFALVAISSEVRTVDPTFGTVPKAIIKRNKATMLQPSDERYKSHVRDFWAVGFDAGWLVMIGFHLHPVEIADFFTGLVGYDLVGDNL